MTAYFYRSGGIIAASAGSAPPPGGGPASITHLVTPADMVFDGTGELTSVVDQVAVDNSYAAPQGIRGDVTNGLIYTEATGTFQWMKINGLFTAASGRHLMLFTRRNATADTASVILYRDGSNFVATQDGSASAARGGTTFSYDSLIAEGTDYSGYTATRDQLWDAIFGNTNDNYIAFENLESTWGTGDVGFLSYNLDNNFIFEGNLLGWCIFTDWSERVAVADYVKPMLILTADEEFSEAAGDNLGAETGDMTGWTADGTGWTASTGTVRTGTYAFNAATAANSYQDFAIPSEYYDDIDNGDMYVDVNCWVRHGSLNGSQGGLAYAEFYDGVGGTEVSTSLRTDYRGGIRYVTWIPRGNGYQNLPSGTRALRIRMQSSGGINIDDIVVTLRKLEVLDITSSMTNPNFETGTTAGWTGLTGVQQNSNYGGAKSGFEGTYFGQVGFFAAAASDTSAYTDVTIPDTGTWYDSIDAGEVDCVVDCLLNRNGSSTIEAGVNVYSYDTGLTNEVLTTQHINRTFMGGTPNEFIRAYGIPFTLGANKRIIRPRMRFAAGGGTGNNILFDDFHIKLYRPLL